MKNRLLAGLCLLAVCGILPCCTNKNTKTADSTQPVFKKLQSSETGITFKNVVDENIDNYFDLFAYVYNGGGVAMGDINNDGLTDIYFTGNEVPNKLYLNEGNLRFKDITESAGVGGNGKWNNGVTMADVNADGLLDIYVCKGGWHDKEEQRKNLLFINQGNLTFKEEAESFGLSEPNYSIHASFFDMDNDNDLDVYITNRPDSFDLPLTEMIRQKKLSPAKSRHKLYKNEKGKFAEVGLQAGINNTFGYALSVVTSDLNNDGFTDIFVANDFAESDYLYVNQGDGTFKEKIREAMNHISMYSMGTDVADINNDGLEDIMVSEMLPEDYTRSKISMPSMDVEGFHTLVNNGMHRQYMHNALHLNQGNLFFSEVSQLSGVAKTEWSWSCLLSDFDNDGHRDLFVANGYKRDVFDGDLQQKLAAFVNQNRNKYSSPEDLFRNGFKEFINIYNPIKVTDYLFRNKGDLRFENVSAAWGITEPSFSNGAAVGDLDNDGDLDLVINNLDDEAFVYENASSGWNNYLKVALTGPAGNRHGIGAKVSVYENGKLQYFENKTVRGYLSSNDPVVHFGLGQSEAADSVIVLWSNGMENVARNVQANQQIEIAYDEKTARKQTTKEEVPLMTEIKTDLVSADFVHKENEVNEYKDQVLLPHMFSRSGPFLSSADVNKDGLMDFFVGGASGQTGSVFVHKDGGFEKRNNPVFEKHKALEDMGSVFFDVDNDGDEDLYVVSGGSEFPPGSDRYNDRLYRNDGKGNFTEAETIATSSSGSCVAAHDFDGDGDLDIFRGGQVVAKSYPKVPRSYLLINEKGKLVDRTMEVAPILGEPGMVNSAIWADINGDKKAELVVAGEWMPIRIFSYDGKKIVESTPDFGLQKTEGWWNRVVADDIDNDGDQDLIAGNLGENYKFSASADKPFQVYAKDFDGNGTNDVFLARYYKDTRLVPIRGRECTSQQMPVIAKKFPTYSSFASSDLPAILGADIENALHYQAYLFSSVILVNEGGKFSVRKLPTAAQLSTVNCISVNDFDGDGKKDILLAGNKFDVEVETTAADASPGLFLKGNGSLDFTPLTISQSGFFVPYNVKDFQVIPFGEKKLVVVGVNNERLRTFITGASPASHALAASK